MSRRFGRAPGFASASRRVLVPFAVFLSSLGSSSARAAEGDPPALALDIEEAARRAAEASPLVRRARAQR